MKNFISFLGILVLVSCNNDDMVNTNYKDVESLQSMISFKEENKAVEIIKDLVDQHKTKNLTTAELIDAVQTAAFKNNEFVQIANEGYIPVTVSQIEYLLTTAPSIVVADMNYSDTAKNYLLSISNGNQTSLDFQNLNDPYEISLVEICATLGDTGDDNDLGVRTIAFAYGYQQNEATAIITAVVVSLVAN